ncbi:MAG: hypothetical protein JWN98_647 [Abditibacteriota bacterium]|nr:hypothetical protein [Abditibacteriota bacterium]
MTPKPATTKARPAAKFRLALPGYTYQFPRDHGAHRAFQTEWWYYTGHLRDAQKRRFGYQLTFFRNALQPALPMRASRWAIRDVMFAHLALTDESGRRFLFCDRIARAAAGLAGADDLTQTARGSGTKASTQSTLPRMWLHDWVLQFSGKGGERQFVRAGGENFSAVGPLPFAIEFTHHAQKPPVRHGTNGISQKSAGVGRASHYYSQTRLATTGTIRIGTQKYVVSGESWFDHEFGSSQLNPRHAGWDWFSLQLGDGRELMLYQLRYKNGGVDPYSSGTLIEKDGRARHLKLADFRIESLATARMRSGTSYPSRWRISLPREKLQLEITPALPDQELNTRRSTGIAYWEGLIDCRGTQNGQPVRGVGYVELTGYARPIGSTF